VKREECEKLSVLSSNLANLLIRYEYVKAGKFTFMNPVTSEEEEETVTPNDKKKLKEEAEALLSEITETIKAIDWTKLE